MSRLMGFVSYSQNFEDVLLWRALRDVPNGRYLDIGAQDPVIDSVSLAFYEAGWRGMHVEPTPAYATRLRDARPDELVVQAAVSDGEDVIEFYEFPGTGLSTGKADIAERHASAGFSRRKIMVPSIKLEQLLERDAADLHWVKIDVEGMEPEVLRSWGSSSRRPWIFVIEATAPLTQEPVHQEWCGELTGRDYEEVYFDGLSRYFLHKSQRKRRDFFKLPPNVFDEFAVTRPHFSAVALRSELENLESVVEQKSVAELELQGKLVELEQRLTEREAKVCGLERLLADAERERASAIAQQLATYDSWLRAENTHRETVERLWREREEIEVTHGAQRELQHAQLVETETLLRTAREQGQQSRRELRSSRAEAGRLRAQAADLKAQLADANRVIMNALAVSNGRWQRLGRALGFVKHDPVGVVLSSWKAEEPQPDVQPVDVLMPIETVPEQSSAVVVNTLYELLSLDGDEFVRSAYATVLGRESDPEGEAYYVGRLGNGISKLQVLDQMRRSPEARLLLDPLPGLDEAIRDFHRRALLGGRRRAAAAVEKRVYRDGGRAHVQQFMLYHDADFVRVLYLFYLNREPDESGAAHHVQRLRRGISRQQILIDVAESGEARLLGKKATGQDALKFAVALNKIPVFGTIFSLMTFNIRIKNYLQDMRALENHLYRFTSTSAK